MDKYLGKKVDGRYQINEIIGIGGMSNVYKGFDTLENRVVAVKILRDEFMDNEDMRRRFKNESKAMAVLNHPNVMRVYDVSFSDKLQSIVMEYIDGITLKEYIEQQGMLKWKEAVHFTVQILRALQHAHDKGIVHRDIKPQNIMLLSDGTIKITDFGIARFARSESRTLTDRAIGSVHYISPEQAAGANTDARTDIYAVGVMLYEMLTGRVPFEADTPVSVALKQIQSEAVMPRRLNPSIPEGLEEITMHAMEKDMQKRYQSAAQMLRDIDEFKRDPSISFEYRYLSAPQAGEDTKYSDAIKHARQGKVKKEKKKKYKPKRAPIIPVLAGVTTAFVVVTAAFIGLMIYYNNPFVTVADVEVPNLVGQNYNNVKMSPQYDNFQIDPDGEPTYNSAYGKGVIYDQTPKAGVTIKVNKPIKVKISKGSETIVLADYAGQDVSQVKAELEGLGLKSEEKSIFDASTPVDSIVKTAPLAGQEVNSGDTIIIYVSMGAEQQLVEVPDLRGISVEDVKTLFGERYKLKLGKITYDETNEEYEPGTITGQSVQAGSQVSENTPIDVTVAGESRDLVRLAISIPLPSGVSAKVTMVAMQDGKEIAKEEVIPSELGKWTVTVSGVSGDVSDLKIYFDGEIYQQYEVDFALGGHRPVKDYSDEF